MAKNIVKPLTLEQKEAASKAAETAKAAAFIAAKRIFVLARSGVAKLLKAVNMERFATPVTVFLLFGVCVSALNMVPGIELLFATMAEFLATVIFCALLAYVGIRSIRFFKRCYTDAREELSARQNEAVAPVAGAEKG